MWCSVVVTLGRDEMYLNVSSNDSKDTFWLIMGSLIICFALSTSSAVPFFLFKS